MGTAALEWYKLQVGDCKMQYPTSKNKNIYMVLEWSNQSVNLNPIFMQWPGHKDAINATKPNTMDEFKQFSKINSLTARWNTHLLNKVLDLQGGYFFKLAWIYFVAY